MDIKAFRGLSGTYNVRASERDRSSNFGSSNGLGNIECLVQFLDNTQHQFLIERRSKGQSLLDCVFKHLNLIETDFFGLKFIPHQTNTSSTSGNHFNNYSTTTTTNNTTTTTNNKLPAITNQKSISCINNNVLSSKPQQSITNSYDQSPTSKTSIVSSTSPQHSTTPPSSSSTSTPFNKNNDLLNDNTCDPSLTNNNNNQITLSNKIKTNGHSNLNDTNHYLHYHHHHNQEDNYDIDNNNDTNSATSNSIEERWLDPTKSIRKQYKSCPPYKFYFRVKFYVTDPSKLADDATRNHLYLQLRQDILNNRLILTTSSAILLASYILQSELGDYRKDSQLVSNYSENLELLLPNFSDEIKKKVIEFHKQHKLLSSTDAKYQFLEHAAKKLDCYGVEFYEAKDYAKADVQVGVSSNGIVVFKHNKKISQFSWAKIVKIMFKKKIFSIQIKKDQGETCDNFIEFNLLTNQACKSFWEECVAQHSFFRLHQPKSPPKKFFSFLNFGSKFQYNGKTEYQTMEESRKRSFSHFSRTPSKRYARRTIPIGRPSWGTNNNESSSQSDNKNQQTKPTSLDDADNNLQLGSENGAVDEKDSIIVDKSDKCNFSRNDAKSKTSNHNNNSWLYTHHQYQGATASCSSASTNTRSSDNNSNHLLNHSWEPKSGAYRPKSLTLKSFIYIDESKNLTSTDQLQNLNPEQQQNSVNGINSIDKTCNANKKDLKRCESLRISNSIKEAIIFTKRAGMNSGTQLIRISESLRDKFLASKSKPRKPAHMIKIDIVPEVEQQSNNQEQEQQKQKQHQQRQNSDNLVTNSEKSIKIVRLIPGKDGKYGFKIRESICDHDDIYAKNIDHSIILYDFAPNSPAATSDPRLYEGDELVKINGITINGMSETKVETLIKNIQASKEPEITMEIRSRYQKTTDNMSSSSSINSQCSNDAQLSSASDLSIPKKIVKKMTLADSIKAIKRGLEGHRKDLIEEFDNLSRKNVEETLQESRLSENIDKNRYRDILPYDSTRVQLQDSMTGDYINASFVDMPVPSGSTNRYIATQGPLASTCEDFWQMVWEQNCSLIIMVTPLIEAGRVKCHKYWPDEKEAVRYGQIYVKNIAEKSKSATIDRTIQLIDYKSGQKRTTNQIQYKAWPDHGVPEDCSDFLKLVDRVRKHRAANPNDPIVVHCSAGIGRTGVLILMETAICVMESGEPVVPIKILEDMRKQRAMLIQTKSQFRFVADAICKVYDEELYKKSKNQKKSKEKVSG